MSVTTAKQHYTLEEYLEIEEQAEYKNEYRDGEIIAMTGGTTDHNKLVGKLYARILLALEDQDYQVYMGDIRLWIPRFEINLKELYKQVNFAESAQE